MKRPIESDYISLTAYTRALEALKAAKHGHCDHAMADEAITAIKKALAQDSNRPIESDYISQVAYTRALEAYCDRQDRIRRAEEAFEAYCDKQEQLIQSYLEKHNSKEDLYDLAVKADNGGQP